LVKYKFRNTASFKTTSEAIWHEIIDVLSYPLWWPNVKRAAILGGEQQLQTGSEIYYEIRGFLPYTLKYVVEVIEIQPYASISLNSYGDLVGRGRFRLKKKEDKIEATFHWNVSLGNLFLSFISLIPLFRNLLEKNHDYVMVNALNALKERIEK
jgi:hypothetical protein